MSRPRLSVPFSSALLCSSAPIVGASPTCFGPVGKANVLVLRVERLPHLQRLRAGDPAHLRRRPAQGRGLHARLRGRVDRRRRRRPASP